MTRSFHKFPSLEGFAHVMAHVNRTYHDRSLVVEYAATVKLHGTNAAIAIKLKDGKVVDDRAQKRTGIITPDDDNAGFANWLETKIKKIKSINASLYDNQTYVVYGEWAGSNIQKGVALNQCPKFFAPFATFSDCNNSQSPVEQDIDWESLFKEIGLDESDIIPTEVIKTYTVDLKSSSDVARFITEVNGDVLKAEECCPFAKKHFDVEGIGEGLVLFPTNLTDRGLVFKAKGQKHSVTKVSKPVERDFLKATKTEEFIEYAVTENRVKQAIAETGATEKKDIPNIIRWTIDDVHKECLENLGDLEWEDVRKLVGNNSARIARSLLI